MQALAEAEVRLAELEHRKRKLEEAERASEERLAAASKRATAKVCPVRHEQHPKQTWFRSCYDCPCIINGAQCFMRLSSRLYDTGHMWG